MRGPERWIRSIILGALPVNLSNQIYCICTSIQSISIREERDKYLISTIFLSLWVPNDMEKTGLYRLLRMCPCCTIQGCKVGPSGLGTGHR